MTWRPGGDLRSAAREATASALASGALAPMRSERHEIVDRGIAFVVRVLEALRRKEEAGAARPASFDPFLPYDERLHVGDASPTHVVLLNKFPVIDDHLLIVTRAHEEQDDPLTLADLEALCRAMDAMDGLAFYNGGAIAGASQRHKHLQLVPVPLGRGPERTPIDRAVAGGALPFRIASRAWPASAEAALDAVASMREELGARGEPFNWLATRERTWLVPRTRERWRGVSVNALGFAGSLVVRDAEQLEAVREEGPLEVLRAVSR